MDVKAYNYDGYEQFFVFENCQTNPISTIFHFADLASWRCPRPAGCRSEADPPADRGKSPSAQNLETSVQRLKITKQTQIEFDIKNYQYVGCDKLSVF